MVRLKRVYEAPSPRDGARVLVDRLWPRGLSKAKAKIDRWMKEIAPSDGLRKWFGHDPAKWGEFRKRYRAELKSNRERVDELARFARRGSVTLLYAAHDEEHNNAAVLLEFLRRIAAQPARGRAGSPGRAGEPARPRAGQREKSRGRDASSRRAASIPRSTSKGR